ncbi:hypothetical protein NPX13_g10644 [Xylaria arbuscula]|uniref:Uncharacterized protein n=1 Tax=Xylaria arbuscula TaxID=114810 RepID=A0A9W8N461_9PEZI|nr:hypothetical protein NPX13_g10644 [Xylaria arbuscula]
MSFNESILDKPAPTKGKGRFAFLKTKRAIAGLSLLVIISVVLIALGATHEFTPHQNEKSVSNTGSLGDNLGSGNGSSNGGNSTGSGDNNDNSNDDGSGSSNGSVGSGQNTTSSDGNDTGNNDDNNNNGNNSNNNATSTNGSDNNDNDSDQDNGTNTTTTLWQPKNSSSIADGTPLRIMCLGASIVRGEVSSDANGFRKTLRGDLAALGAQINMVGSQRYGDMPDNDFEAYGGNRM